MFQFASRFIKSDSGATAIEYGLIAALVAVALIAVIGALGVKISGTFNRVANGIPS